MAGTTVVDHNNVAETLQQALLHFDCVASIDDINKVMGLPKPVAIEVLLQKYTGIVPSDDLVDRIYSIFEEKMISHYVNHPEIGEMDGTSTVFSRLRESGIKVGIDTGFSRNVADAIISRLGWNEMSFPDVSITSDEVEHGRPHPDMIFRAMDLLKLTNPAEVAKVGDTISDLREGNAAGCAYVIGIAGKANSAEELAGEYHTHIITSIREVPAIVLQ